MLSGEAEVIRVRVLVAFEDTYRAYGDAIVRAIRTLPTSRSISSR
jgi:hypothetical protein